jgi:ribonuclease HII
VLKNSDAFSAFAMRLSYEQNLLDNGITLIAGVDEVGRGPLAGPIVVAAVILDLSKVLKELNAVSNGQDSTSQSTARNNDVSSLENEKFYWQINDSKKISHNSRNKLNALILKESICYSIVEASNKEIDQLGIGAITKILFHKAVKQLPKVPQHVLTDCFKIKELPSTSQTNIIKGDSKSISIAAASIIAKVYRDTLMEEHHKTYPHYGFATNKGYGTAEHITALKQHGHCDLHRLSFEPVKSLVYSQHPGNVS